MIIGYFVLLFPLAALLSLACYLPYGLIRRAREIRVPMIRHVVCYALIGVVWSILFVTLLIGGVSFQPGYRLLNLTPFIWLRETYVMGFGPMIEQLAMNVAMLVPGLSSSRRLPPDARLVENGRRRRPCHAGGGNHPILYRSVGGY